MKVIECRFCKTTEWKDIHVMGKFFKCPKCGSTYCRKCLKKAREKGFCLKCKSKKFIDSVNKELKKKK